MSCTRQSAAIPDITTVSNRTTNYEKRCALFSLGVTVHLLAVFFLFNTHKDGNRVYSPLCSVVST